MIKRLDPMEVAERFRDLNIPPRAGELGVTVSVKGTFIPKNPAIGVCALGIMCIDRRVPPGYVRLQDAVNACLQLDNMYAHGIYDGFAGWGPPESFHDLEMEHFSSYIIGHADGIKCWKHSDPAVRAREVMAKAAKLIRENGWTRATLESRGRYAIDGAIRVTMWGTTKPPPYDQAYSIAMFMLENFLRTRHLMPKLTLAFWNDHICASLDEAVMVLESVAQWKEEESIV